LDEIDFQVDCFERKYGPTNRRDFDGEFYVPAEVRARVQNAKGSLRIHGGLLTMSRSRTLLTLTSNPRNSIHSSTPDLSRSIPSTPGSNHKLTLTSSYDSVLEENENEGVIVIKKGKSKDKKSNKSLQNIFGSGSRRKSEELLETRSSGKFEEFPTFAAVQRQQQHVRQSSDQAYRLIPRVKPQLTEHSQTSEASNSVSPDDDFDEPSLMSQWGAFRGSNSFASNLSVGSISTNKYSIPRVSLSYHKFQPPNDAISTSSGKSMPENSIPPPPRVIMKHNNGDSNA
jgi:hypothetical protein